MVYQDVLSPSTLIAAARAWTGTPSFAVPVAVSVEVISDPTTFANMGSIWNATVDRAHVPHPFLRHEWLHTWWECFGTGRRLHIVLVKSAGQILAIAPLMWESARMFGVPVRRLRLLQNDHTPDADFILTDHVEESYRAIWQSLFAASDPWDVLLLGEVARSSATMSAFKALAAEDNHAIGLWPSDDAPFVAVDRSWEAFNAGLGAGFRQNLRNRWARLSKLGTPALEILSDPVAIRENYADALHLEASGWKQEAGTSIESDPPTKRFYAELADRAGQAGWLRLLFLTINGRRIATAYGACYQNRLLYIKTGYDPEFAKCSPSKILTHLALRHAFDTGLSEVDFLGTAEPWKREWTTTTRPHDWLFIFGNTVRGRLVHQLKFRIKPTLQHFAVRHAPFVNGHARSASSERRTATR